MRAFSREHYWGLKTATSRVLASYGCLAAAAASLGVSEQLLSGYQNKKEDFEARFIRLDLAVDAMKETQDLSLLDYMAGLFGKRLVDDVDGSENELAVKTVIRGMAKMSATELQMAVAIEDGDIDRQEAAKILKHAIEAQSGLANVIAHCSAIVEGK